jgi:methylmalonyl-CoA mutase
MANSKNKLFNDFPPISTEQWEEVIKKDLKGADYDKKLLWKTLEGFKVRPYYRIDDIADKDFTESLPGEFPYIRGNKKNNNEWEIRQDIKVNDLQSANDYALFILDRGVTSLGFNVKCKKGNCKIQSKADIEILLKDIYINCIGLYFNSGHNSPEVIDALSQYIQEKGLDKSKVNGAVCYDPLGYLSVKGAWGTDEHGDFEAVKSLIEFAKSNLPAYRVLALNGQHFNNAGASVIEELAFTLAMAADYFTKLTDKGLSATDISRHLQVNLGVGTNYFMEIAKVRAARYLFASLLDIFQSENKKIFINSFTSGWHDTIYDPYVNVLRTTNEAMSASIGGTDALVVRPFDKAFKKENDFSDRLARNIQIILKEESYFDKVIDPSAGSYYIENLTDSIIEESWKLFLEIDSKGGYLSALKEGFIQSKIEKTANTRLINIATRREILLGTNQFPNFNESVKSEVDKDAIDSSKVEIEGDIVTTIKKFRGAEAFEELRLATENHSKRPKVFMLTIGNLAFRKARATFSCNFFACAGYEVLDNLGFDSIEDGVNAAIDANSDIIVICSSDDEYAELVPKAYKLINGKALTVVAGAPACMDDLKNVGIEHFIHVRSNVLETLKTFNHKLGIDS